MNKFANSGLRKRLFSHRIAVSIAAVLAGVVAWAMVAIQSGLFQPSPPHGPVAHAPGDSAVKRAAAGPEYPGGDVPELFADAAPTGPHRPLRFGEEAADWQQRHYIPFQELRIAGGGAPAGLPGTLVAIFGTGRFRSPRALSGLLFSPDGTTLATGALLRQWCLESGHLLHEFPGAGLGWSGPHIAIGLGRSTDYAAPFSQDSRMLAWQHGNSQNIAVWNGFDARVLVGPGRRVGPVFFCPNGRWLIAVRDTGDSDYLDRIDLWDVTNGHRVRTFGQYGVPASFNGFGQRGTMLAAQEGKRGMILRLDTLEEVQSVLCSHIAISPDEETFAWIHGKHTVNITPIDALASYGGGGREPVTRVVYSPDSQWVAAWFHQSVPREEAARRNVRLWHVPTGEHRHVLEFGTDTSRFTAERYVGDFAFSPNGRRIVLAGRGRTLRMYEVPTGELVWEFREAGTQPLPEAEYREHTARVVFGSDGRTVLFGSFLQGRPEREMTLHDAATGKEIATAAEVLRNAAEAAYSPDGRLLAVRQANERTRVTLWSVEQGKELFPDEGHAGAIRDLAFSPDGSLLASCADDGTTRLWDVSTGRLVHRLTQPDSTPGQVAFFPDGQRLSCSGPTGTQVWDVATGGLLRDVSAASYDTFRRRAVAFGGNGKILAAPHPSLGPAEDMTTRFWDLATGDEMLLLDEAPEGLPVAFSADGRWFASVLRGVVSLWDLADRRKTREIETEMEHLAVGVFSPDGASFAAVNGYRRSSTPTLGVWDTESGRKQFALSPRRCYVNAAFTPDGKRVAAIDWAGNLRLFDAESGAEVALHAVALEPWGAPPPFALSPTGRHVAVGMSDGTIHVHRLWGRPASTRPVPPVEPTVEQ